MKSCDRGQHFQPDSHFFTLRTDLKPADTCNMFIFSCSKLVLQITTGFVLAILVIQ